MAWAHAKAMELLEIFVGEEPVLTEGTCSYCGHAGGHTEEGIVVDDSSCIWLIARSFLDGEEYGHEVDD